MYMLNMVIILIVMYCNVVTAIDKIPTYLLRFNRKPITDSGDSDQIILKIVLQYFEITMSYFSCCSDTFLSKCLSEHLIYELTYSWLICFVQADTLLALSSRRHEPWYVRSADSSGGYPYITPQK